MKRYVLMFTMFLVMVSPIWGNSGENTISWGVLIDLSGPTSVWGKIQAQGQLDAVQWINEQGGIRGKKLKLIVIDDKYKVHDGVMGFKRLTEGEGVVGIYIQSTGTTLNLAEKINKLALPTFGASFTAKLQDPAKTPYNFFVGPSYADQARVALKWIADTWQDTTRRPKVVFLYPDNTYGRDILDVAKDYAKKLNIMVGADQVVDWPTLDATTQLHNMKKDAPDFAYLTSTTQQAATVLKDAKRLGVTTKFVCNIRSFDESILKLAGAAAEGVYGVQPFAPFGSEVSGMRMVKASCKSPDFENATYVEGWVNILVIAEGLRIAAEKGTVTPASVKAALETIRDFDPGGLAPPITFTPDDHRASTKARIFKVENGTFKPVTEFIDVGRDREYVGQ